MTPPDIVRLRHIASLLAAPLLIAASSAGSGPSQATPETTVTVVSEADYRDALTALSGDISGPHTIVIGADIELQDPGDPTYTGTQPLSIDGQGHTISGTGNSRLLRVDSTADLSVAGLTMLDGTAGGDDDGGAIESLGPVRLNAMAFLGNAAAGDGGAVHAAQYLSAENSQFKYNQAGGDGGALSSAVKLFVTGTTLSANTAQGDGGAMSVVVGPGTAPGPPPPDARLASVAAQGAGQGAESVDRILLGGSTLNGNRAGGDGGAMSASGGGLVVVVNSTFAGNRAGSQGGAVAVLENRVHLIYVTMAGNDAPLGSQIATHRLDSSLSVLANGVGGDACSLTLPTWSSASYDTDGSCGLTGPNDTSNGPDPDLGPLADNNGPTLTMEPGPGSPLIDVELFSPGLPAYKSCPREIQVDQRGEPRRQGRGCDTGAVEVEPAAAPPAAPAAPVPAAPAFTG